MNHRINEYFMRQAQLHAVMEPQDAVKLCYQAAFGAEHLLQDTGAAKTYFDSEFLSAHGPGQPVCEQISSHFFRVNLGAWKACGIPGPWLFALFRLTAQEKWGPDSQALFGQYLAEIEVLAAAGKTPFTLEDWKSYTGQYKKDGLGPVHHSKVYRQTEAPAYRIIYRDYARVIPLLQRMAGLIKENRAAVLAIDGRAAAGKTTLSALLESVTGAGVVHMDDFFLPAELRTEARLSDPGGNVHYERFSREVAPKLQQPYPFSYQMFDCQTMEMGAVRTVSESNWRIVEGAYSCHPALGNYMDLRVFCDIEPRQQLHRIRDRNGQEMEETFASRWIPMEERYFDCYSIKAKADIIVDEGGVMSTKLL